MPTIMHVMNRRSPEQKQEIETHIDHLVYQLYNLTPEEIAVVEGGKCIDNKGALCQR
jgi:hypothetical protein